MNISEAIRQAVHESGWAVDDLSERVGVSPSALQEFLAQEKSPFELADKLSDVLGLEVVEEIDFDEYVDQHWPEYAKAAWDEYEKEAWYEAKISGWAQDDYNEWYETEYPEWESKERTEWEQAERDRLESLSWVSIIGDD